MNDRQKKLQEYMPAAERVAQELQTATSINDFFGKEGIFSRLFSTTIEKMVEAELTDHLGYPKHSPTGDHSGNSRNGSYTRTIKTSAGTSEIAVSRDREGTFKSPLLKKYQTSSNEIEDKVVMMYARGMTVSDIQDTLAEMYGIELSPTLISTITAKIMPLVEEWQSRPLEPIYTIIYLDCIHVKLRREGKIENTAVYNCLGIDVHGHKNILGHWVGTGGEGATFWLSVVTEIQARGVKEILIAAVDGLKGFSDAIHSVYPATVIQRCIIHQIRNSLKYVVWKDKDVFMKDLKAVYQAATKGEAETALLHLSEVWSGKYAIAVKSWENNWDELSAYFDFSLDIRRLMYTTNIIESYNRQLRKVTKSKSVFPTADSIRKMFYLAMRDVTKKWTMPIANWGSILNQLAIRFEGRVTVWFISIYTILLTDSKFSAIWSYTPSYSCSLIVLL